MLQQSPTGLSAHQLKGYWPLTLNAFGDTNYAAWIPVFLKVSCSLSFVVQSGEQKFSLSALDQSQEHSEASGLYSQQEEDVLTELSKPEVLRAISEYESVCFGGSRVHSC